MIKEILFGLSVRSQRMISAVLCIACVLLLAAIVLLQGWDTYKASAAAAALMQAIIPLFLIATVVVARFEQA